eukprot:217148_1
MLIAPSYTGLCKGPSTSRSPSPAPPPYAPQPQIQTDANDNTNDNTNNNSWQCLSCGILNVSNASKCKVCPAENPTTANKQKQIWCWKADDGLYMQYSNSISNELDKLNIDDTYIAKIGNATYQIKKTSKLKCLQTNIKTKCQRLVILQNCLGSEEQYAYPSLQQNKETENKNQSNTNDLIQSQLLSMGFEQRYITRAITVYQHNYDDNYDIQKITEIIFRLKKKDEKKIENNENETTDFLQLSFFNAAESNNNNKPPINVKTKVINENVATDNDDFKVPAPDNKLNQLPISEWSRKQLKYWIYTLDMIFLETRKKIIDAIEEFQINAVDFQSCQNGQEIADTFDIDITIANLLYGQIRNIEWRSQIYKKHNAKTHRNVHKSASKKLKKHKYKTPKTWKTKAVKKWNCQEMQDWICSLDMLSEYNKLKLISGIEMSKMTGTDFVSCEDGEDIAHSFDGISVDVCNLLFDELNKFSKNYIENEVSKLFYSSLSKRKYKIVDIKRIKTDKDRIYEQILSTTCQTSGKRRSCIEKFLWHGSKSINNLKLICKNGFDRSYNKHSHYGPGTYFASDASYSVTGGFCGKDNNGVSHILLCKVIVGDYMVGNRSMRQIPRKSNGEEYDSLVNSMSNPTVFVVWRDYHAIPYYLIRYRYQ